MNHKLNDKEMKKYQVLHTIEKCSNYSNNVSKYDIEKSKELAEYISVNYDTMDEYEMRRIASKCMDINAVKKNILAFELKNYVPVNEITLSLDQYKGEAFKVFHRYQCKAGGFNLEDNEWILYDKSTPKYDVKQNELLFENTISFVDEYDDDIEEFLYYLIKRLSSIAKNISADLRYRQNDNSKVLSILIWITDNNMQVDECEVGL